MSGVSRKLYSFKVNDTTTVCRESCSGMFVINDMECSKQCNKSFYRIEGDNFICQDDCDKVATGYYFNGSDGSGPQLCASRCAYGQYLQIDENTGKGKCTDTCDTGFFVYDFKQYLVEQKVCVTSCDSNIY